MFILILFFVVAGCSGSGNIPLAPDSDAASASFGRTSWGYWEITLDETTGAEVLPMPRVAAHLNVLGFLEQSPCQNCVEVNSLVWSPGKVDAVIGLRHPFPGWAYYTGFDVRGICFLPGTFSLPAMMQTMPDIESENYVQPIPGEYLGYTDLFNPVTSPDGLPNGYAQGKLTPWTKDYLTSSLGAFQYYASYPDNGLRNVFESDDVITNIYRIIRNVPGPIVFGYSVDASWQPPEGPPPVIVPDDFPSNANCLEAWKVELTIDDAALTADGGELVVTAVAHDHQGSGTIFGAYIECPELSPGSIEGTLLYEDVPNGIKAFELTVPNVNLTASAGEKVNFVVKIAPLEEILLYAFNASTATVHEGAGECPPDVHSVFYGQGEFGQFGNFTIAPYDAAVITSGALKDQFIMFGNGFAGSMMGAYDISDLGVHDPNGLVGLVGVGAPSSLDVSPAQDHIFLVMPYSDSNKKIVVWRYDGTKVQEISSPNDGYINCVEITPDEEIWFIEQVGNVHYLHHAVAQAEWSWQVVAADSQTILMDLPVVPRVFDLVYEPVTQRIFVYHTFVNGSITAFDASGDGPPKELPLISKTGIWGYSGPLLIFDGSYFNSGPDIEIDLADAALSDCRIIASANFELGGSAVAKFDADLNMLDSQPIEHGPFMTFAISVSEDLTKRRLIFLPLNDFEDQYYLFDPPANW